MANSSSSEITNSIENRIINLSEIQNQNNIMSEIITNSIISNQSTSKSQITQLAEVEINDIIASGKDSKITNLDILLDQDADIQFSSDDRSIQNNNILVDYALSLTQQLQNSISNEQAAKLASEGKATQENGFLSLSLGNKVSSNVNNQIKNILENTNVTKLFNNITSTIQQNTETLNFKECIMNNLQSGKVKINKIAALDGGLIDNVTIGIKQSIKVIQKCVFDTLQKSDITAKVAQDFNFKIINDMKNKQEGDSKAKSEAVQINEGVTAFSKYSVISIALLIVLLIGVFILKGMLKKDAKDLMKEGRMSASEAIQFSSLDGMPSARSLLTGKRHK